MRKLLRLVVAVQRNWVRECRRQQQAKKGFLTVELKRVRKPAVQRKRSAGLEELGGFKGKNLVQKLAVQRKRSASLENTWA